jgi:hypothetical protein
VHSAGRIRRWREVFNTETPTPAHFSSFDLLPAEESRARAVGDLRVVAKLQDLHTWKRDLRVEYEERAAVLQEPAPRLVQGQLLLPEKRGLLDSFPAAAMLQRATFSVSRPVTPQAPGPLFVSTIGKKRDRRLRHTHNQQTVLGDQLSARYRAGLSPRRGDLQPLHTSGALGLVPAVSPDKARRQAAKRKQQQQQLANARRTLARGSTEPDLHSRGSHRATIVGGAGMASGARRVGSAKSARKSAKAMDFAEVVKHVPMGQGGKIDMRAEALTGFMPLDSGLDRADQRRKKRDTQKLQGKLAQIQTLMDEISMRSNPASEGMQASPGRRTGKKKKRSKQHKYATLPAQASATHTRPAAAPVVAQ